MTSPSSSRSDNRRWRPIVTALILLVTLQTLLIYFGQFSSFDREMNWLSVFAGARPAPVFWGAVLADAASWWLLLWLLQAMVPHRHGAEVRGGSVRSGSVPGDRSLVLPYVLLTAAWLLLNHFLWGLMVQIFRPGPTLRWLALGVLATAIVVMGLAVWLVAPRRGLGWRWLAVPPLGLAAALLLALDYFLLAVPVVGDVLRAAADTGIKLGFFLLLARLAGNRPGRTADAGASDVSAVAAPGAPTATAGQAPSRPVLVFAAVAGLAMVLLPGPKVGAGAIQPPPFVVQPAAAAPVTVQVAGGTGVLEGGGFRVSLTGGDLASGAAGTPAAVGAAHRGGGPTTLTIQDSRGKELLRLAPPQTGRPAAYEGVSFSHVAYDFRLIPLFWTGNTMKSAATLGTSPLTGLHVRQPLAGSSAAHGGEALVANGPSGSIRVSVYRPGVLKLEIMSPAVTQSANTWDNTVNAAFVAEPDEHFLGLGERLNTIDQRGHVAYNFVEELGYSGSRVASLTDKLFGPRGSFPNGAEGTSWPVPFVVSSKGYGLYLDSADYSRFDLAARYPDTLRIAARGQMMTLYVLTGDTPLDTVGKFATLTGLPPMPQPWVFLPWKSRTGNPGEDKMQEDATQLRALSIPDSVINMEGLQDVPGSYDISGRRYPDLGDLLHQLKDEGYRATFWHFPYFNRGSAAYAEGIRKGYFVKNRLGLPYHLRTFFAVSTVLDYTNPAAAQWHEAKVERWLRLGFSGFMNDYGESIPPDAVFYNGRSGEAMRNLYPLLYTQAMDDAARAARGDDYTLYPRAGYTGAQRVLTSQWPGDQSTDWDQAKGLPAALRAMLNASIAGVPYQGSDIGGFLDIVSPPTDKELFIRWAELGAYSPIMRAHGGMTHPVREPWRFDAQTVDIYRRLADEHTLLFPYLYSLAREATLTGEPLMRHPALLDPSDPKLYGIEDEYLLGDALLVAPVVQPGVTQRNVYLPAGRWIFLSGGLDDRLGSGVSGGVDDSHEIAGPTTVTVPAPLGQTPLFLRQGQMLPRFTQVFDTFDPSTDPQVRQGSLTAPIRVTLFPGLGTQGFTLDDGVRLTAASGAMGINLSTAMVAGGVPPASPQPGSPPPVTRLIGWDLRGIASPAGLTADGVPLSPASWHYDRQTHHLRIDPLPIGTLLRLTY